MSERKVHIGDYIRVTKPLDGLDSTVGDEGIVEAFDTSVDYPYVIRMFDPDKYGDETMPLNLDEFEVI